MRSCLWKVTLFLLGPALLFADSLVGESDSSPQSDAEWDAFLLNDPLLDDSPQPAQSSWITDCYIDLGYLWSSNALESVRDAEEALAAHAVLSGFAQRTFAGDSTLTLLAEAEMVHFTTIGNIPHELFCFAVAQYEHPLGENWLLNLTGTGIYLQNPYDGALAEDAARDLSVVRFTGLKSKLDLRRTLAKDLYATLSLAADRSLYNNPGQRIPGQETIGDFYEFWSAFTLNWDYAKKSSLSLAYSVHERDYDSKTALSATGTTLAAPVLNQYQHRLTARWKHTWDNAARWSTTLRTSLRQRTDNASGYYDYYYLSSTLALQYQNNPWTIRLEFGGNYTDYRTRTNGSGQLSHLWEPTATLDIEYALSADWTLLANIDYLDYHSNRPDERYSETRSFISARRYF